MAGIVFLKTNNLRKIVEFYKSIGSKVWLDQGDCVILQHDNFLFGFCEKQGEITKDWLLTFFYKTPQEVDALYEKMKDRAETKPHKNDKYNIYRFFSRDPEGRDLEFQAFLHEIEFNWHFYNQKR
jgi:hypothetical protein